MVPQRTQHQAESQQVVSVRDSLSRSFAAQLVQLREHFASSLTAASPEAGFIHYVFDRLPGRHHAKDLPPPIIPPAVATGVAPDLATIGFLSAVNPSDSVLASYGAWSRSFSRLQNKEPFPIDRQAFTFRPVEFLGICLGARTVEGLSSNAVRWLRNLVPEQRSRIQGRWNRWLSCAANVVLSDSDDLRDTLIIEDLPADELALLIWLKVGQPFSESGFWRTIELAELRARLLERCSTESLEDLDPARAAMVYAALRLSVVYAVQSDLASDWQVGRPKKDARELVQSLCRRFHRMAHQLLVRHQSRTTLRVKDEYDVQDLMHAMLVVFFNDVREETWTPNYAGNSSRTDFVLWDERVIVEVKMTRKSLSQKEIANQLIIDKERYKVDPRCETLICFVYDPGGLCKNPAALETDLAQAHAPETIVVIHSGRS